jgi:cob(I)alamin adenosyltransferase
MRLPEIQKRLSAIADELMELSAEISRRKPGKPRSEPVSTPVTPELRRKIRQIVREKPDVAQHVIASRFRVNPGRVSEAISGKRK